MVTAGKARTENSSPRTKFHSVRRAISLPVWLERQAKHVFSRERADRWKNTSQFFKTEVKYMKQLMLTILLMTAFASITSAAADQQLGPIPEDPIDFTIPPPPTPPVPECWPVC